MPKKNASQPRLIHDQAATYDATQEPDALAHLRRPLTTQDLDKVRHIEGFPIGADEDIIALSDPPYYTACPNPFLEDFIKAYGKPYNEATDTYHREPFASDVSEGKNDPIYNAHSYHTKVPHKAIMRYILHYTEPGDIVFDGFCGTGMTGVAAQMCGNPDPEFKAQIEAEMPGVKWGKRRAVLCDLSPAATFIAYNYNTPVVVAEFEREARRILDEVEEECGWMYETLHTDGKTKGRINYTVWSEVFACPNCGQEIIFSKEALDADSGSIREEFPCPRCRSILSKATMDLLFESRYDPALGHSIEIPRRRPILINYSLTKSKFEKPLDSTDLEIIRRIDSLNLPIEVPTAPLPDMQMGRVGRMRTVALTHLHHFFLPRAAQALGSLWRRARRKDDVRLRNFLLFWIDQAVWGLSVLNRYSPSHFSQVNRALSGVFYVASQISEVSPRYNLEGKLNRLVSAFQQSGARTDFSVITTENLGGIRLPDNSIDYVFTDPPFGENIYYSDLNLLVESWYGVKTSTIKEAIIDRAKTKTIYDYQRLMEDCFASYFRVLRPGRWMTVEFHNSKNSIWNAIHQAIQSAGFVVADVRTLNKVRGSFQQVNSANAVKQDLVISAYKPSSAFERHFLKEAGTEQGAWDFIRQHLGQLPVFVEKNGAVEVIAERQNYLLFDRMVAFHIQRGASVPLSAAEFYAGLRQRFPERDGMYFLPEQVAEYDTKRAQVAQVEQLSLFVSDEKSAVQWLRTQLEAEPQTYQDIQPKFLQELHQARHEKMPELRQLLEENFLKDDEDRWYAPDPAKAEDLEKLRERGLLREFATYVESKGRLKTFRTEAVRAGFKSAWGKRDYKTIIEVARRLPEDVLQEDPALLMYYDNAVMRAG
jgi:DNA modification methylase